MTVELPDEFADDSAVSYAIVGTGSASFLGARSGTVGARAASRSVVVTIGVPATALGGLARAGFVRFTADGRAPIRVPLDFQVTGTSRIEITPQQRLRGGRRGDRIELSFTISNRGNVRDTLDLTVDAPASWRSQLTGPPRVVLLPGETTERTIVVNIPTISDLGEFGVGLVATTHGGVQARGITAVGVGDGLRPGLVGGPTLTLGAASAYSAGGTTRSVESAAIEGRLSDELSVSGRFSAPVPLDPVTGRALSMLGYSSQSNYLSLASPRWGATVGTTGVSLSDLAGQSVFGRGGSLRLTSDRGQVRLLSASPFVGGGGGFGWSRSSLVAASGSAQVGANVLTAFLVHLRDSAYTVRVLDAAGAGIEARPWSDGVISGEVAARSYRNGSGLGAAGAVQSAVAGGELDLRITHAPGGTAAFAPASDAITIAADRAFGRLHMDASFWSSSDERPADGSFTSTGWALAPSFPLLPSLSITSYLQGSTFTASGEDGRFASTQRDLGARGVLLRSGFELSADSRISAVSRAVNASVTDVRDESRRVTNRLRLDHVGARGEFGVGGSVETSVAGATSMQPQTTVDAHVDRLQIVPWFPHFTMSGTTQRFQVGNATLTTTRLEANLDVQRSTRIVAGVERGTARDAAGLLRTVLTLKVERAASLPGLGRRAMSGVVFQDRNGNGVRDAGEPGAAGIVVRRGSESAVTDADGVFRVDGTATGRSEIDPRSLPAGWLQSPRSIAGAANDLALGVIPVAALDIDVVLAAGNESAIRSVRIGTATLTLRDSSGRAWIARSNAASHATFDAVPVGSYRLAAELEGSSEPLLVDAIPPLELTGASGRQRVTVTVRTRPLRIFQGQP
ncbi:MAG TPA: hypothetical protein VLN49_20255 [Gemmatimonadaceae bacterium]|nr:hypothetical protein [Gemmatimonadaceae bacterium]